MVVVVLYKLVGKVQVPVAAEPAPLVDLLAVQAALAEQVWPAQLRVLRLLMQVVAVAEQFMEPMAVVVQAVAVTQVILQVLVVQT
jgi:hypothetical protein